MAYDFGNLAAPVKSDKAYDFGSLAKPVARPSKTPPSTDKRPDAASTSVASNVFGPEEAILNVASGIVAKPVSDIAGLAAMGKEIVSPSGGDPEGFRKHVQEELTYQPRTAVGKGAAEYNPISLIGKGVGKVAGATGGAIKGDSPNDSARGIIGNAVQEGIQQGSGFIGVKGAPRIAREAESIKSIPMAFKPDPQTLALARKAQELGIPLRPDMLTDNKIMRSIGEALESVPLSGSKAKVRQEAFNRALIQQIGGDKSAAKLTPDVFEGAIRRSGTEIGAISRKTPVKVDDSFSSGLDKVLSDSSKFETSENSRIIQNYVTEIKGKIKDGVLDGTTFRKLDSSIGRKIRSTQDGYLRSALGDIQESMREALNRSLPDDATRQALQSARTKYAKAMSIEPLVAKSKTGDISPAGLMGRVTSDRAGKSRMARGQGGDMGDLAKIGQAFIKEQPSSGTAERTLGYGALGGLAGGAAFTHPISTGSVYGMANLYNRLGPLMIPDVPKK